MKRYRMLADHNIITKATKGQKVVAKNGQT
jgi:hypothetical protein